MQTRKGSFTETVVSTVVGFLITMVIQLSIFPLYGIHLEFHQDLQIVGIFTVASIARGYALRRVFNNITVRKMLHVK